MSASTTVDLGNTAQIGLSIFGNVQSGGPPSPCSGTVVGEIVDMINSDTYCNVLAIGCMSSGMVRLQVQVADVTTSGSFTDPMSGLTERPGAWQSGAILFLNSGGAGGGGITGARTSGNDVASGYAAAQGFIRTGRYVRALMLSGDFGAGTTVAFVANQKVTGSGGGYTWAPGSGTAINV